MTSHQVERITLLATEVVTAPLVTVHLPPERAVLTTPGMIGLMERCIAGGEASGEDWRSRTVELRHRAGLKTGERLHLRAELANRDGRLRTWRVSGTADDDRVIGEGTIVREQVG